MSFSIAVLIGAGGLMVGVAAILYAGSAWRSHRRSAENLSTRLAEEAEGAILGVLGTVTTPPMQAIAMSRDGRTVVGAGAEGYVYSISSYYPCLWGVTRLGPSSITIGDTTYRCRVIANDIATHPDGRIFVADTAGTILGIFPFDSFFLRPDEPALTVALSPDGETLFATTAGKEVNYFFVDLKRHRVAHAGSAPTGFTRSAWAPDGHRIYAMASGDDRIYAVDAASLLIEKLIDLPGRASSFFLSPSGERIVATLPDNDEILTIDLSTRVQRRIPVEGGGRPTETAVTPDGKIALVVLGASNSVAAVDLASGRRVAGPVRLKGSKAGKIVIRPDGRRAFVLAVGDGIVTVLAVRQPSSQGTTK